MWSGTKNGGNEGGTALENETERLVWDFEVHLRKTTMMRRSDLTLEDKAKKKIWICDMACPQQRNIEAKRLEKLTKYRQLTYEMRERERVSLRNERERERETDRQTDRQTDRERENTNLWLYPW